MKTINWTAVKLKELKAAYDNAVKLKSDQFYLGEDLFVTAYAKYLIEYLEGKFHNEHSH
jgi:hypothetical protein